MAKAPKPLMDVDVRVRRRLQTNWKEAERQYKEYGEWFETVFEPTVPISQIILPKPWNNYRYEDNKQKIKDTGAMPPAILHFKDLDQMYTISDGIHRINAAKDLGYTHIPAIVSHRRTSPPTANPKTETPIIEPLETTMKPGDTVTIYEDPLTEKQVEGEAKLIELIRDGNDKQYWLVEFQKDHARHVRWIKTKEKYHHSDSEGTLPTELFGICTTLQSFIDEEEKGIEGYESFIQQMNQAIKDLDSRIAKDMSLIKYINVLKDGVRTVNRIMEEERVHVKSLKWLKSDLCPEK